MASPRRNFLARYQQVNRRATWYGVVSAVPYIIALCIGVLGGMERKVGISK